MRPNVSDDGNGVGRFGSKAVVSPDFSLMSASEGKADVPLLFS